MERLLIRNRDEYFAMDACSKTALSEIRRKSTNEFIPKMSEEAMSFGSLVDALITQIKDVDTTHPRYKEALKMRDLFLAHPFCRLIYETAEKQVAYTDMVEYIYGEMSGELYCKCLFDFDINGGPGADLKTVSVSNKDALMKSIYTFDWDLQAAFYMTVSRKTEFSILAMSKLKPLPPMIVHVKKGDEIFWSGHKKMMQLMNLYDLTRF
jgi:hypothetical protein